MTGTFPFRKAPLAVEALLRERDTYRKALERIRSAAFGGHLTPDLCAEIVVEALSTPSTPSAADHALDLTREAAAGARGNHAPAEED